MSPCSMTYFSGVTASLKGRIDDDARYGSEAGMKHQDRDGGWMPSLCFEFVCESLSAAQLCGQTTMRSSKLSQDYHSGYIGFLSL